jgi:TRAP-type C4-dicarboxylate transport system permease small subunit
MKTDPSPMRRGLDLIYQAAAALAAGLVFAILLLMIGQALFRALGWPTTGVNEVVGWLTAAAAALALAHSFRHGDFVRVGLLRERLGPGARRFFEGAALIIGATFVAALAVWAVAYTVESWRLDDRPTGEVALPLWIPHASFALGTVLLLVAMLDELWVLLRGGTPSYLRSAEERHARGDFNEDL